MTVQFLKERYHAVVLVSVAVSTCRTHESWCADRGVHVVVPCVVGVRLRSGVSLPLPHCRPMVQQRTAHWISLER